MTRRTFLDTTTAAALSAVARRAAANDRIGVAHVGVGGMGQAHVGWFAAQPDTEILAVCDVDSERLAATRARLEQLRPGRTVDAYEDFRHLLDRPDIDVITTATPDHWHATIAMLAFEAGKDVYGEKPLAHNYAEARAMETVCRRSGRIFQLGTQIHAGDNYHRCVELVRSGALGKLHTIRLWKSGGSPGLGWPADEPPPASLNWDLWLGPAPERAYNPALQPRNFRHFWDYSGGVYADFWCHVADLAFWAVDELQAPRTVVARGATPTDGVAETPAWIEVDYDFGDLKLEWRSRPPDDPLVAGREIGVQFVGSSGSLVADYTTRAIRIGDEVRGDLDEVPQTIPRSPGHQRQFLDSVRSRVDPGSHLGFARRMTAPLFLGEIAFRLGRALTWDAARERFVGDREADRLLSRPPRAPWHLPA